jgi:aspartate aminotransferase-like enzyme
VDVVEVPWGEAHDPEQVRTALESESYDAVTMAHSETSTGVLNDVRALTEAVRDFDDTLVLVDSVSGFGATELRPDEWGTTSC